ncbi:conjugal transfer protein MobC [Mucilaginibacter paludis]|uniref:Type IV secretory pathway VirD4 components-like protein n=1 Tax=Mucilaginibacter paludis DSM 18603 TaxID=714943 RepID=H1YDX4_9SPHI|nr:conjugal transfer protein MobC [Mucilaginibacter paludis]EHQ24314.1 type IV secretory pathway VirD4 components-like protein [Mucilaginibacter paludis DSM 18603]
MNNTGENTEGLRKIIDMTRQISLVLLILHFYVYCYGAFRQWGLSHSITDKLLLNLQHTGLFDNSYISKLGALMFLLISLIGAKGKKDEDLKLGMALRYGGFGLLIYGLSQFLLSIHAGVEVIAILYMSITSIGYMMIMRGGALLSRILQLKFKGDIFNKLNESFPQEERLLTNEYSINLPAQYNLKGNIRKSWINIINPFRALLVIGTPGAGKSYFVIRHVITQHIKKGFSLFVYDFKYDDLSRIVYNTLKQNSTAYKIPPAFYVINFDNLGQTHRCNPLEPGRMDDITDASESSRTIMLGLNREWIKKQGDFFVESPINFVTAIIWFLKKYRNGIHCTLPHVIELMQVEYHELFSVLRTEPEIEVLINPFVSAYKNRATDQLEGQIASAKISMARLASPQLYYVLNGNDFTLDLNNPDEPKVICMGNNPQKQQIYGAVLSLYISRMIKLVNQKNKLKSSLIFDEFPTIYFNGIDSLIATARSNKVATCLGVQDYSQLKKDYGREQAEVIMNIVGNIVSGQVVGDTAKQLSERFGKIMQERESVSINSSDTSVSKSMQLDSAIPASKISGLSSGEFVGMVADDPMQKIELKTFHAEIINDHEAIKQEEAKYSDIPQIREVGSQDVEQNYLQVKKEIKILIDSELERMSDSPNLTNLILKKIV